MAGAGRAAAGDSRLDRKRRRGLARRTRRPACRSPSASPSWRDADGNVLASTAALGKGRVVILGRALLPETFRVAAGAGISRPACARPWSRRRRHRSAPIPRRSSRFPAGRGFLKCRSPWTPGWPCSRRRCSRSSAGSPARRDAGARHDAGDATATTQARGAAASHRPGAGIFPAVVAAGLRARLALARRRCLVAAGIGRGREHRLRHALRQRHRCAMAFARARPAAARHGGQRGAVVRRCRHAAAAGAAAADAARASHRRRSRAGSAPALAGSPACHQRVARDR